MAVDESALALWAILVVWMVAKMHLISAVQLGERLYHGRLRNPEDVRAFRAFGFRRTGSPSEGVAGRADAAWRNDVENIPMFVITALGLALLGAEGPWYTGVLLTYGALRTVYTGCYLLAIQPWRTIVFEAALLVQVAAGVWLAVLALS